MQNDTITISRHHSNDPGVKLAICHALAQVSCHCSWAAVASSAAVHPACGFSFPCVHCQVLELRLRFTAAGISSNCFVCCLTEFNECSLWHMYAVLHRASRRSEGACVAACCRQTSSRQTCHAMPCVGYTGSLSRIYTHCGCPAAPGSTCMQTDPPRFCGVAWLLVTCRAPSCVYMRSGCWSWSSRPSTCHSP